MLMELKTYLSERRCASLSEIAGHLATDADAIRPMLERWIAKGKVQRTAAARCRGCATCREADLEFYQWMETTGTENAGR